MSGPVVHITRPNSCLKDKVSDTYTQLNWMMLTKTLSFSIYIFSFETHRKNKRWLFFECSLYICGRIILGIDNIISHVSYCIIAVAAWTRPTCLAAITWTREALYERIYLLNYHLGLIQQDKMIKVWFWLWPNTRTTLRLRIFPFNQSWRYWLKITIS